MDTQYYPQTVSKDGSVTPHIKVSDVDHSIWRNIKNLLLILQLKQATTAEQAEQLVKSMVALHRDLENAADFIYALHLAQTTPRADSPWIKQTLIQDNELYLELITYFADYPTPIHDFPGCAIVNLPLSGRMCVDYYVNGHAALESSYPIAKLKRISSHTFGAFEAAMSLPWDNNIQEIRATSERCITLSAGLKPTLAQEKSWFLPISPQNNNAFFAQRLRRNE